MITRYNKRAKEWNNETIAFFSKANFSLENTHKEFVPYTQTSGSYYPIRDTCTKKGDPNEGCMQTDAFLFKAYMDTPVSSRVEISIASENKTMVKSSYDRKKEKYYTASQIGCSKHT